MLIEFRVKNFRSFKDEQALSLVASNDSTLGQNYDKIKDLKILRCAAIYGANASGKSNLIKAIQCFRRIVRKSSNADSDSLSTMVPFLLDEFTENEPSLFEVVFIHDEQKYQYGFTATKERIMSEWLYAFPNGSAHKWFIRDYVKDKNEYNWSFGASLKGDKKTLARKTRHDSLFISVANQWNNPQLMSIFNWFEEHLRIVPAKMKWKPITAEILYSPNLEEDVKKVIKGTIATLLNNADLGISDINIKKIAAEEIKFSREMDEREISDFKANLEKNPIYDIRLLHRNAKTGKELYIPITEESDGTRHFFNLIGPWLEAISGGITVVIDELESSLHPLLTRELVRLIQNPEYNINHAQLIFTTHDTTLLDPELFRRDQIWFTEKYAEGDTKLYSMHEYKERRVRKGEAMQKGYLIGRYGAIPILQSFGIYEPETTLK